LSFDPEEFPHLSKVQLQVAKTTHALVDVLDATRKLHPRFRLSILRKIELYLYDHIRAVENLKEMKPHLKRRPLKTIMGEIYKKNVQM